MPLNCLFDKDGYVKLPPKVSDTPCRKIPQSDCDERIQMCLNCTKKCCKNGTCKEVRKIKNKGERE